MEPTIDLITGFPAGYYEYSGQKEPSYTKCNACRSIVGVRWHFERRRIETSAYPEGHCFVPAWRWQECAACGWTGPRIAEPECEPAVEAP